MTDKRYNSWQSYKSNFKESLVLSISFVNTKLIPAANSGWHSTKYLRYTDIGIVFQQWSQVFQQWSQSSKSVQLWVKTVTLECSDHQVWRAISLSHTLSIRMVVPSATNTSIDNYQANTATPCFPDTVFACCCLDILELLFETPSMLVQTTFWDTFNSSTTSTRKNSALTGGFFPQPLKRLKLKYTGYLE